MEHGIIQNELHIYRATSAYTLENFQISYRINDLLDGDGRNRGFCLFFLIYNKAEDFFWLNALISAPSQLLFRIKKLRYWISRLCVYVGRPRTTSRYNYNKREKMYSFWESRSCACQLIVDIIANTVTSLFNMQMHQIKSYFKLQ